MQALEENERLDKFICNEEIHKRIAMLGDKLSHKYANKQLIVIGVLNGSFIFLSDLVRKMDLNMKIDFVACKSYEGTGSTGKLMMSKELKNDIANKHVLLVEDIIDTGFTLSKLVDYLRDFHPLSLELVTLLDKKACHNGFTYEYTSLFEIENVFVVGYGFDCDERFRQLPDIYSYQKLGGQ